jgi:hypothetical protein
MNGRRGRGVTRNTHPRGAPGHSGPDGVDQPKRFMALG